jgi:hypothetical protein
MEKTAALLYGRNDGYKEDNRVAVCLESMLDSFDEVWFLDWNSPKDKNPLLWDLKDKLPKTGRLKHIVIPPNIASIITNFNPKAQVCLQTLSTNIMLRRCNADWIAATTIDIIAPKKEILNNFLSSANKSTFYTVARRDIEYSGLEEIGFENWREFRDKMDVEVSAIYYPAKVTPNDNYSLINCCGDFQLAHRDIWHSVKGFEEQMIYACFQDTNVQKKAVLNGYNLEAYFDLPLYHLSHKGMANDGSSPSKQYYNDAWDWVEVFQETQNDDNWGLGDTEIEFETI